MECGGRPCLPIATNPSGRDIVINRFRYLLWLYLIYIAGFHCRDRELSPGQLVPPCCLRHCYIQNQLTASLRGRVLRRTDVRCCRHSTGKNHRAPRLSHTQHPLPPCAACRIMADLPGWTLGGSSIEKMMSASGLDCLKKQGVPIASSAQGTFGVRFSQTLPHLRLTRSPFGISRNRVRHKIGFGHRCEGPPENRLGFFSFPTHKQRGWGTHNPLVEGSSPSRPTTSYKNHGVSALRPADA